MEWVMEIVNDLTRRGYRVGEIIADATQEGGFAAFASHEDGWQGIVRFFDGSYSFHI